MGIREVLERRRARTAERRERRTQDEAMVREAAEYLNSSAMIYATAQEGVPPPVPVDIAPDRVVERALEIAGGSIGSVSVALDRARSMEYTPSGNPRGWSSFEYEHARYYAGLHAALYQRRQQPDGDE